MLTKRNQFFKQILIGFVLMSGGLFAQNTLTMTDNPVAAMLDSFANQKMLEKALLKPIYPKNNKYKFTPDSVPRYEDFVYESRLAKLDAVSPFDLVYNPHVRGFIELYAIRKRELVSRMMGLSQLYYPMFEEIFDKHNIPLELKHLAVIESALNVVPSMVTVLLPIVSLVMSNKKISELLNNANSSKPGTIFLNSGVATFQYLKKEKKFPLLKVETGCFFSLSRKIKKIESRPGIKAR